MKPDIISRCYARSYDFLIKNYKEGDTIYMGREEKKELLKHLEDISMVQTDEYLEDPELLGKKLIFVEKESWLEVA